MHVQSCCFVCLKRILLYCRSRCRRLGCCVNSLLCDLLRMMLTMNNFTFNQQHYLQIYGTAMGTNLTLSLTDKHQLHLLISSCHAHHIKIVIPFRLALRVYRIYSTNVKFKLRINELETYLLGRGYNNTFLEAGFLRAANIPRANARYRLNLKILTKEDYAVFS